MTLNIMLEKLVQILHRCNAHVMRVVCNIDILKRGGRKAEVCCYSQSQLRLMWIGRWFIWHKIVLVKGSWLEL